MTKKERKLTPAELKRKEVFEVKVQELTKQGYQKKDLTISVLTANIMAVIVMLPVIVLFYCMYFTINRESFTFYIDIVDAIIFLLYIAALIAVHEGIHGITWALFAKEHFRSIEFGVIWGMLTPYCTCKTELTKGQYILGGIMPTIIVGILPAIIAVICNYPWLFQISLCMIVGGGGDVLIILKLLLYKANGKDSKYMDHPYKAGLVVFERTT